MKIESDARRAANLLKAFVNKNCEDGFVWYPDVGEMPTIFDINYAIEILEKAEPRHIQVVEKNYE